MSKMEVTLLDRMGSDLTVVNAARVSFAKQNQVFDVERDTKLIRYLAKHKHWTPFAHPQVSFHVKAPIFVARQLGKHQVGLVWNEVSRRYVDSDPEFYMPKDWRARPENAKQGSSDQVLDMPEVDHVYRNLCAGAALLYYYATTNGVAPEMARMILPQSMMTEWIWTGSLMAWARVVKLRLDPHSQVETQEIARQLTVLMFELFPISWQALMEDV